jgi:glycosyltransferase involved in cell wall biosynthesis
MERPVIATDHGGARETVLPGNSGLLTPPRDSEALAQALRKLIAAGPAARAAMGAEGRAHIARHFTVDRMTADTIALYRELLGKTAADGRL